VEQEAPPPTAEPTAAAPTAKVAAAAALAKAPDLSPEGVDAAMQKEGAPIHVIRGTEESYYDPRTRKEYPTAKEAIAGVPDIPTPREVLQAGITKAMLRTKMSEMPSWKHYEDRDGNIRFYNPKNPKDSFPAEQAPDRMAGVLAGKLKGKKFKEIHEFMDKDLREQYEDETEYREAQRALIGALYELDPRGLHAYWKYIEGLKGKKTAKSSSKPHIKDVKRS
jgi:hypothetical protein